MVMCHSFAVAKMNCKPSRGCSFFGFLPPVLVVLSRDSNRDRFVRIDTLELFQEPVGVGREPWEGWGLPEKNGVGI